jgi:hypothetical protein
MLNRSRRRFAGWLALAALALHLLAPTVSQAIAALDDGPAGWPQICGMHALAGSTSHAPGAPDAPGQDDGSAVDGHCPFCTLHFAHWISTAATGTVFALPQAALPAPADAFTAPTPRLAWAAPQSRAPPRLG